jgi:hypothetical protein
MPNLLENTPKVSDKTIMTDHGDAGFAIFYRKDRCFLILGVGDRMTSQFSGWYIDA